MILDGRSFTACDIADALGVGADVAFRRHGEYTETKWLAAYTALVSLKVKVNNLCIQDANNLSDNFTPQLYKKGDGLWSEAQRALAPVADDADVQASVAYLPPDTGPLAASPVDWLRPALVAGGLGLVGVLGFLWVRSPVTGRRRRR